MKHQCTTCKFRKTNPSLMPCGTCNQIWGGEACIDNWQPAKRKRKELQAQLDAANVRVAELEAQMPPDIDKIASNLRELRLMNDLADLQAQLDAANARVAELENRENPLPDNRFTMPDITFTREELDELLADAKRYAEELEILKRYQGGGIRPTTLEVANAEIESMHKELAAKNKEIADVWKQLSAAYRNIAELASREASMRRELRTHGIDPNTVLREDTVYQEAKARRKAAKTAEPNESTYNVADLLAIIAEQNRELDEVKEKLRLMEIENRALRTKIWLIKWARLE